jgi:hypothetical protein
MLAIVPEACLKNPQPLRSQLRGTTDAARVERGLNLPVNLWVERDNLAVSTDASSRVGVSALSTSESTTPGFRTPNLASSQDGIRVLALIGVASGFIVAPFQAFHRMRIERDEAHSGNQFGPLFGYRHANALSFTSWLIDRAPLPLREPALSVHGIAASSSPAHPNVELDSDFADRFRLLVERSAIAEWMRHLLGETNDAAETWRLVLSNGFQVGVQRDRVPYAGGGSEVWARVFLALPRGYGAAKPSLTVDFISSDLPAPGTAPTQIERFTQLQLNGSPYRVGCVNNSSRRSQNIRFAGKTEFTHPTRLCLCRCCTSSSAGYWS